MSVMIRFVCVVIVALIACKSVQATLFTVDVVASDGTHSQQVIASTSGTITTLPDGVTQNWKGSTTQPGSYTMQWDLTLDPDPSISGSIALTNSAATTQTFTLSVSQPIASTPAGSAMIGSSAITIADANGSGAATVGAPAGSAIYTAFYQ
jgi:hypothetical protein